MSILRKKGKRSGKSSLELTYFTSKIAFYFFSNRMNKGDITWRGSSAYKDYSKMSRNKSRDLLKRQKDLELRNEEMQ